MKNLTGLLILLIFLSGCSVQKGVDSNRRYAFDLSKNTGGIYLAVQLDYQKDQDIGQDAKNTSDIRADIALKQLETAVQEAMKAGVPIPKILDIIKPTPPVKEEEEEEPTPPVKEEEEEPNPPIKEGDIISEHDINMKAYKNKSHAWIFRGKSHDISGPAIFTFSNKDCGTYTIKDLAESYDPDHNKFVYFSAPYELKHGHGDGKWEFGDVNGVFTPNGCTSESVNIKIIKE